MKDDPIESAFNALNKVMPSDDQICIYRSGILDSAELMQLLLELEIDTSVRFDLASLMEQDITLTRIKAVLEGAE